MSTSNVEDDAVPGVRQFAFAYGLGIGHRISRINSQGHRHDRVATVGSLQGYCLRASLAELYAVPCVGQFALAYGLGIGQRISRINSQGHRHYRVATVGSLQGHRLCASLGKLNTIPSVGQLTLANALAVAHRKGRINSQSHRHYRVATVGSLQGHRLCASLAELYAVPSVGQLAFADGLGIAHRKGRINSQSHRHYRVATVGSLQGHRLCASLAELYAVPSVGQLAFADGLGIAHRKGRINSQSHRHYRVATVDSLQGHHLSASLGKLYAVPSVRQFALAYGLGIGHRISRINNQGHRHHRVATRDRRQGNSLGTGLRELYAVPSVGQLALAYDLGIGHRKGRINSQGHRHHRVAARSRWQGNSLGTGRGELYAVPGDG